MTWHLYLYHQLFEEKIFHITLLYFITIATIIIIITITTTITIDTIVMFIK
jgi:hypothetical protein